MSNFREMAPQGSRMVVPKTFIMNMLYTTLKHVVWRFRIYNYFREILEFREIKSKTDFAKFLKVFIKSQNLNISQK